MHPRGVLPTAAESVCGAVVGVPNPTPLSAIPTTALHTESPVSCAESAVGLSSDTRTPTLAGNDLLSAAGSGGGLSQL